MSLYRFKLFQLDAKRRYLLKEGQVVPLTAKLFDILLLLVQKRGELVTKDELMKEIWADQIVEENNLTVNISTLRKILNEGNPGYEFIKTVPKRGYRFVAQVSVLEEDSFTDVKPQNKTSTLTKINYAGEDVCSLAVMPLVNESRDPSLEYFSDGVTDSIIYSLSQLPQLKVLARNTVFQYKGRELNAQEVGQALGVETVLIGRVLQFEDRLIFRTELINSGDGSLLWGEEYNRPLADIFAIQDEVAREVSEKLQLKLTGDDRRRLTKRYTDNHEAYQLYLKGRYFWNKFNKEWVLKSIQYFRQAIEIDPSYALAYAGLADAHLRLAALYSSPREVLPEAKANALKAVELDNQLAEAHAALGLVKSWYDFDWSGAENEHLQAIALNPVSYLAHEAYGRHFMYLGRFDDALKEFEYAIRLDPLFLQLYVDVGVTLYLMREYDRAIEQYQKVLDIIPNYYPARFALAWGYIQKKDFQAARLELEQIWRLGEDSYLALGLLGYLHSVSGDKNKAAKALANLEKKLKKEYVSPYSMILTHLGLGDTEKVFEWLEKLYEDRSYWLIWLNIIPELSHLRSEPRFKELLNRVGLAREIGAESADKTLAVLPFLCVSRNAELEYFCDGIAEMIINNLSHAPELRVISKNKVFQYKGHQFDPVRIGRDLQTEMILAGWLLQAGEKLIILTELIDVINDTLLKIEQFEYSWSVSTTTQNEVAREISEKLRFEFSK